MKVVSVINHKGGVGKTTVAANVGVGLAMRDQRVLLIDLDPQSSLTYSFVSQVDWSQNLADSRTLKQWLNGSKSQRTRMTLSKVTTNLASLAVNADGGKGSIDLIASHTDLAKIDGMMSRVINVGRRNITPDRFVQMHRRLIEGLQESALADYDIVIIDCPPSFDFMTSNAILASDNLLVPLQPDAFSYNGTHTLRAMVEDLVERYNRSVREIAIAVDAVPILPPAMAVVFTMVEYWGGNPRRQQNSYISRVKDIGVPTFDTLIRERAAAYAAALERREPVIMDKKGEPADEFRRLVDEVYRWIQGIHT